MPKSWSDLVNELRSAKDKATGGYQAIPRGGWLGRIFGPKYVPLKDETEQSDDSSIEESITIEEEIRRRKTVKKNRFW